MWHETSIMSVDLCYMTKVILETSIIALDTKLVAVFWPFSAWCPLKCHTYLNKPAAESPFFPFLSPLKVFNLCWAYRSTLELVQLNLNQSNHH